MVEKPFGFIVHFDHLKPYKGSNNVNISPVPSQTGGLMSRPEVNDILDNEYVVLSSWRMIKEKLEDLQPPWLIWPSELDHPAPEEREQCNEQ